MRRAMMLGGLGRTLPHGGATLNRTGLELELLAGTGYYSATSGGSIVTANGSTVKRWEDQSGNSNHATDSTGMVLATNAVNSLSALTANGNSLTTTSFLNSGYDSAWTMIIVHNNTPNNANYVMLSQSGASMYFLLLASNFWEMNNSAVGSLRVPIDDVATKIMTMRYDGTIVDFNVNGRGYGKLLTGSLGLSGGWQLGQYYGGGFTFPGKIAETLCFKRAQTRDEMANWVASLRTKFGVASTWYDKPIVVCDGNSMTTEGVTPQASYPSQLEFLGNVGHVYILGVGGSTTDDMISRAATRLTPLYLSGPNKPAKQIVCAWEMTNHLYFGASSSTAISSFQTYCLARKAEGWKVIALTVLPRSDAGTPGSFETDRQTCNTWLRSGSRIGVEFDALADIAADSRIGDAGDELDTTYFADRVHMTAAGYAIVAGIVDAAIVALP